MIKYVFLKFTEKKVFFDMVDGESLDALIQAELANDEMETESMEELFS